MEKISIWKRVGGWLRKSHDSAPQARQVNTDGLLIHPESRETNETVSGSSQSALFHRRKSEQVIAMEEGFNRLVEVLESINENVTQQRDVGAVVRQRLDELPQMIERVSETILGQHDLLSAMNQQMGRQTELNQQQVDLLSDLPESARDQIEKLQAIRECLDTTLVATENMATSFSRIDQAASEMSTQSHTQTTTLQHLNEVIEQTDHRLEQLLKRQSRRFFWMILILGFLFLATGSSVIWLILSKGA